MAEPAVTLALAQRFDEGFGREFAFESGSNRWAAATTGMVNLWAGDQLSETVAVPGYLLGGIRFAGEGVSLRVGLWTVDVDRGTTAAILPDRDLLVSALEGEATSHPELFRAEVVEWNDDGSRAVLVTKYNPPRGLGNDYQHHGPQGQVLLVDVEAAKVRAVLEADTGLLGTKGVALSHQYVALTGPDIAVYELDAGNRIADLGSGGGWVATRFSPDGEQLAAIQRGGMITIWSTSDWSEVASWPTSGPSAPVLAFDDIGTRLASAGRKGPIQIWSVNGGSEEISSAPTDHGLQGMAFDPTGRLFVATTPPGQAIEVLELR